MFLTPKSKKYFFVSRLDARHNLKDPNNLKLTTGGLVCDIKISNDDVIISCKNNYNSFFSFKLNECLVFQKLSDQEKVLLSALDYLND